MNIKCVSVVFDAFASFTSPSLISPTPPLKICQLLSLKIAPLLPYVNSPHSSSLSPSLPPLPIFIPMLLSLHSVSRAVGQAELDDNATVIGRETNDCDKERRGEENRKERR